MALLVGVFIGLVLGLTGAGGSLFAVPLLSVLLGLPLVSATGIALGAVAASAGLGVWQRKGVGIVWLPVSIVLVGGVVLAPVGRWLAGGISAQALLTGFSLLVMWVALRMWRQAAMAESAVVIRARGNREDLTQTPMPLLVNGYWPSPILVKSIVAGMVTGLLSGLLGVGGGFVIVPILTLIVGLTMAQAVASSLLIICFVSLSGFAAHWWLHEGLDLQVLVMVSSGGLIGMLLGSRLASRMAGARLQRLFSLMLVMVLGVMWFL
ncbi:MAG: sulfite exporter TauE/SafE family protein [Cellvibrionaceae bacterium]